MHIDSAFNFALDYETANLQSDLRDGTVRTVAALSKPTSTPAVMGAISGNAAHSGAAASTAPTILRNPHVNEGWYEPVRQLQQSMEGMIAKQKITEMQVQEMNTKAVVTNDKLDTLEKKVGDVFTGVQDLANTFKEFSVKPSAAPAAVHPIAQPQQYIRAPMRAPWGGNPRFGRPIRPSITGGAGYVNNQVRPQMYRRVEPGSNVFVRPTTPATNAAAPTTTAAATASAPAGATTPAAPSQAAFIPVDQPEMMVPTYTDAYPTSYYQLHPVADPQQQAYQQPQPEFSQPTTWWTDGMVYGAAGYDDPNQGTYTYCEADFQLQ